MKFQDLSLQVKIINYINKEKLFKFVSIKKFKNSKEFIDMDHIKYLVIVEKNSFKMSIIIKFLIVCYLSIYMIWMEQLLKFYEFNYKLKIFKNISYKRSGMVFFTELIHKKFIYLIFSR